MILYVVRHGQTDWNVEGRIQGHNDICLNETGKKQAQEIAKKLKNIELDFIVSSPLSRALDTAKEINKYKKLQLYIDNALVERDFGDFDGKNNLSSSDCTLDDLLNLTLNYTGYHVEPIQDLFIRVKNFIEHCKTSYPDKNILLVTHGGICQILDLILNNLPTTTNLLTLSFKNCEFRKYIV